MSTTTMEQPTLGLKCDTPKAAPIVLTEKAAGEVKKIITDQVSAGETRALHLRMRVVGGGCSGFQAQTRPRPGSEPEARRDVRDAGRAGRDRQAQPAVPRRRDGRFPRRPEQARLQHHQPTSQGHLRLRQLVLDVSRLRLSAMTDPDHFARLGLPRRFALDLREVERQYLARQPRPAPRLPPRSVRPRNRPRASICRPA